MRDATGRLGDRDGDGRPAAGRPRGHGRPGHPRVHRPGPVPAAAEHVAGRSTPRRRSGSPAWPGRRGSPPGSSSRSRPSRATCCPIPSRRSAPPSSWWATGSRSCRTSTPTPSWPSAWRRWAAPPSCRWGRGSARTRGCAPATRSGSSSSRQRCRWWSTPGLGAPSHAAEAMEIGADAVLVNTAIAVAGDPVGMARAFRLGVEAGRRGVPGRAGARSATTAEASSPLTGFLEQLHTSQADPAVTGRDGESRAARRSPILPPTGTAGASVRPEPGETVRRGAGAGCRWTDCSIAAHGAAARRRGPSAGRRAAERTLDDFAALLSPAAAERLEELAGPRAAADAGTVRAHHAPVRAAVPVERVPHDVRLLRVRPRPADRPQDALARGDAGRGARPARAGVPVDPAADRRARAADRASSSWRSASGCSRDEVPSLALEVQVWSEDEYRRLVAAGCDGRRRVPGDVPPRDVRAGCTWPAGSGTSSGGCSGPERAARAGMRRVGIGALLGLHDDWRYEAIAMAAHARFLMRRYWRTQVTVERAAAAALGRPDTSRRPGLDDRTLVQLVCALRLAAPRRRDRPVHPGVGRAAGRAVPRSG